MNVCRHAWVRMDALFQTCRSSRLFIQQFLLKQICSISYFSFYTTIDHRGIHIPFTFCSSLKKILIYLGSEKNI